MTTQEKFEKELIGYYDAITVEMLSNSNTVYETRSGVLFPCRRPEINTCFSFGYGGWSSITIDQAEAQRKFSETEDGFIEMNMKKFNCEIEKAKNCKAGIWCYNYDIGVNVMFPYFYRFITDYEEAVEEGETAGCPTMSKADIEDYIEALEIEKAKFEKRLRTYYKKYGSTKLITRTYVHN